MRRGYRTSQEREHTSTPVVVEIEPLVGEVADGSAGGEVDVAGGGGGLAGWEDEGWDCEEGEGKDCSCYLSCWLVFYSGVLGGVDWGVT